MITLNEVGSGFEEPSETVVVAFAFLFPLESGRGVASRAFPFPFDIFAICLGFGGGVALRGSFGFGFSSSLAFLVGLAAIFDARLPFCFVTPFGMMGEMTEVIESGVSSCTNLPIRTGRSF